MGEVEGGKRVVSILEMVGNQFTIKISKKMARITAVIKIDFDTENLLTKQNHDQCIKFRDELNDFVKDQFKMAIYEIASESGLESSKYPLTVVESILVEFDSDKEGQL